jgi:uncharacterized membrane protein YjgN (DUF898 family)
LETETPAEQVPAAPLAPELQRIPFEFRGNGAEYFRIWIVNLLLSIFTLGIYSAWAKVRRLRYFYGSTVLADSAFEFHGSPVAILKGRLIAFTLYVALVASARTKPLALFLILPVAAVALPWIVVRARRFRMRMSSFRNIRFGFHASYAEALRVFVVCAVLTVLTLYLLLPAWLQRRVRFSLANSSYGALRIEFAKSIGAYYGFWIVAALLWAGIAVLAGLAGSAVARYLPAPGELPVQVAIWIGPLVIALLIAPVALGAAAYYRASAVNAAFDGLAIGPHRIECRMRAGALWKLYAVNLIGLLITLGLFYPWARVRLLQYQFECMALHAAGGINSLVAEAVPPTSAAAEEIADFFDVDFGL